MCPRRERRANGNRTPFETLLSPVDFGGGRPSRGTYPSHVPRRLTSASHARRGANEFDHAEFDDVDRLLAVLESASIIVDRDGAILRTNERAIALGLVSRGRIAIADVAAVVDGVLANGGLADVELRVRRPPLGRELMDIRVRATSTADGNVIVLVTDLGDARRTDVVRRDFVANVSHELKTPVGALSLLAEAILASADEPEQVRVFAERMRSESARLSHLVQDLIDLSRLQADDPLTHAEVIEVDDLVDRMVDEVRTLAAAGGVDVIVGDPSGADIFGDRRQIQMALRNLLVNAVSYSSPGTTVAVDARISGSMVEIRVKDQGIGIPANELDRIFERFYRVDPARSRATGGTGLGLSIVKHVCQNHGGECSVWSEVGVGSTFALRLPLYPGDGPIRATAPVALVEEVS